MLAFFSLVLLIPLILEINTLKIKNIQCSKKSFIQNHMYCICINDLVQKILQK